MENVLRLMYENSFRNHRQNLSFIGQNVERSRLNYFKKEQQRLDFLEKRLISLDSSAILRRGFTITCDASGQILKNAAGLLPDATLTTVFADGTVESTVKKLKKIAPTK
jgi:exodeoxyribonuclease VII large subunit